VWTAIQSLDCRGSAPQLHAGQSRDRWSVPGPQPTGKPGTTAGRSGHQRFIETPGRSAYSPLTLDEGEGRSGVRVSPLMPSCSWAVHRCSLPLSYQLFDHFGLPLQPGQPRLLVHASHLLAGSQS
jgi:hypothetical protein